MGARKGVPFGEGTAYDVGMHRSRLAAAVATGTLALALALTSCGAPAPSASGTASASASRTAKPTPADTASGAPSATTDAEPDPESEPLPSSDPATLDWFGLDQGAVTERCRAALAESFPGAAIDDLPSRTQREEKTVVSFEWIVRGWEGAPDFAATCQLGLDGGAISSVFVTVQDL